MDAANLYLNLLEECLTRSLFIDEEVREVALDGWKLRAWDSLKRLVSHPELRLVKPVIATPEARRARAEGKGHHSEHFETSIGFARLDNIRNCVTSVLEDEIPGRSDRSRCAARRSIGFHTRGTRGARRRGSRHVAR